MRRPWWFWIMLAPAMASASEPVHGCFRTPMEAALGDVSNDPLIGHDAMKGTRDSLRYWSGSFRVEGFRRDVLLGRSWAVVRSCEHPERPAVVIEMLRAAGAAAPGSVATVSPVSSGVPVLIAGNTVRVTRVEQNARLTMEAVAERSAAVGERVRLRVVREAGQAEQFVVGVVRGAGLVEMEEGR